VAIPPRLGRLLDGRLSLATQREEGEVSKALRCLAESGLEPGGYQECLRGIRSRLASS
jgi:hypothetical protein